MSLRPLQGSHSANERRMSGIPLNRTKKPSSSSASTVNKMDGSPSLLSLDDNRVKVAVRCRPMSDKELDDGHQSIVEFESDKRIVVHDVSQTPGDHLGTASGERKNLSHVYDFDRVFSPETKQEQIYDSVCRRIVESVLEGYNGTIFAYGQTGTGKTFTMEGSGSKRNQLQSGDKRKTSLNKNDHTINRKTSSANEDKNKRRSSSTTRTTDNSAGIIPRTFEQIFEHISKSQDVQFLVRASYLEIYQEEIRDLLRKDKNIKLELHERSDIGVYVKDLTSFVCKSIAEIERVMKVGNQNRIVAATDMNEHSSRSHAIFMITVEQQQQQQLLSVDNDQQQQQQQAEAKNISNKNGRKKVIKVGKLNLVDLAGSERQRKTNSSGQRQQESIKINLSLSALGNVINSLMKLNNQEQKQQSNNSRSAASALIHTPYRDSKLTRLLQDSLGGNARTLMIASIGPASYNYDETINTLNYASRARCIKNKPRLNEDPKDALLRELQREIELLRAKLKSTTSLNTVNDNQENKLKLKGHKSSDGDDQMVEKEFLQLKQKLSSLERKLLNGDKFGGKGGGGGEGPVSSLNPSLLEGYTREQEIELELRRNELANQSGRQKAIQDELEKREMDAILAKKSFNSIQQELDAKRKLIRQLLLKAKSVRDEITDTQRAYRLELDDLDQLQYVLQKELRLKCLIMDNFIPNNHVDQLLPRIVYDERRNCCSINPIELAIDQCNLGDDSVQFEDYWRPTYDSIRPRSEFERISEAIYPNNIRYKYEDLIEPQLELDKRWSGQVKRRILSEELRLVDIMKGNLPEARQTRLQEMINEALNRREPDIVIG